MTWQPIETAPRDGTQLLVACENGLAIAAWSDEQLGPAYPWKDMQYPGWVVYANGSDIEDEGLAQGCGFTLQVRPTHWMPLPEPPHTDSKGGAE